MPKESRRHVTKARGGFLCRRFFEREEEMVSRTRGQERCSFTLSSRSLLLSPPFLPPSPSLFLSLSLSLSLSLFLSRASRHKTKNTKQNRMLLGFCRAPLKPPCAVPCGGPMILQASEVLRGYYYHVTRIRRYPLDYSKVSQKNSSYVTQALPRVQRGKIDFNGGRIL